MTEHIGEAFRPIFKAAMAAWWAGDCKGVCPMNNWQFKDKANIMIDIDDEEPMYDSNKVYRFKPVPKQTVTIGYRDAEGYECWKTLVAPETVEPRRDASYFVCSSSGEAFDMGWDGDSADTDFFTGSCVFLTLEDAQAMSDWLAVCRRGGA